MLWYFKQEKPTIETKSTRVVHDTELVLLYFGVSSCAACNDPRLRKTIKELSHNLSLISDSIKIRYTTIGVSIDEEPEEGLNHLKSIIEFNELSIGNGLTNKYFHDFIINDSLTSFIATPQIFILKRTFRPDTSTYKIDRHIINDQKLIGKSLGVTGAYSLYMSFNNQKSILKKL